ncbi:TBC1 domain family member 30 isoform X2 [Aphis craccivora]|uniref:TBC1 domain family member 30 isoform X2 n=1 Tax=Aphis craccivora TaxID=307492 RepID=A0A6G0ZPL6_APHCR|nr:TBC1 domain family member 30 isoform X2 [Aphis craccivora]
MYLAELILSLRHLRCSIFMYYLSLGVEELCTTVELLRDQLNVCCEALVKALKRRDILIARRDAKCNMITALLHAYSMKRSK